MVLRKHLQVLLLGALLAGSVSAQYNYEVVQVMTRLDSIRKSPSVSRHFAGIYFETTVYAIEFFSSCDSSVRQLIDRLEKSFATNFFISVEAYECKTAVPGPWKSYYADQAGSELRYILFGVNAHINGDIWQALTAEFTLEEIRKLKPWYYRYYKGLLRDYRTIYKMALASSSRLRLLHVASFGLDRIYGKMLLRRWRKRQMMLAELFYTNKPLFEKKLARLRKKAQRLDNLIRKHT